MPKTKKVKDFEKQKLKVGKKKPENSNATRTSFQAKTLVLPSQLKAQDLTSHLSLTRHHQATTRKQALVHIGQILHLHEHESGNLLRSVAPLMVDQDLQVRLALLDFLQKMQPSMLSPHINLIAVHIHAAMTHINPGIRADSTRYLDIVISKCPEEFVRQCFTKTLTLYFPLFGWPLEGKTQAGSVSTILSLGKLAPKARTSHLSSLNRLLSFGLQEDSKKTRMLFHNDTEKFMIPLVGNPYDIDVTDDVVARQEALETYREPLVRGLEAVRQEGGDTGRIASRIITLVN